MNYEWDSQTQRLAAHRVEVRQSRELVIRDLLAVLLDGGPYLCAELILDVRVLAEEVEDAREPVRRGVRPCKREGAGVGGPRVRERAVGALAQVEGVGVEEESEVDLG